MSILSFLSFLFIDTPLPGIVLSPQIYLPTSSWVDLSISLSIPCADRASRAAHSLAASLQIVSRPALTESGSHRTTALWEKLEKGIASSKWTWLCQVLGLVGGYECLLGWPPLFSEQLSQPNVVALVPQASMIPSLFSCNNMMLHGYANHLCRTPTHSLFGGKFRGGKVQPSAWVFLNSLALGQMFSCHCPYSPKNSYLNCLQSPP